MRRPSPAVLCSQSVAPTDYGRGMQLTTVEPGLCSTDAAKLAAVGQRDPNIIDSQSIAEDQFVYNAIAFVPKSAAPVMELVKAQLSMLKNLGNLTYVGFDNATVLDTIIDSVNPEQQYFAGIVFNLDDAGNIGQLGVDINSPKIHYTIRWVDRSSESRQQRWQTKLTFPEFTGLGPRGVDGNAYLASGWTTVQAAVDQALAQYWGGAAASSFANLPPIIPRLKPFPFIEYADDPFVFSVRALLPLILVISYLYSVANLVQELV